MNAERDRVRELVKEELGKRLGAHVPHPPQQNARHPALHVLHLPDDDPKELDPEVSRPCVIEPDRPCYQSGYCKRLGY
jgi:hypothetical protein